MVSAAPLLSVRNLAKRFRLPGGPFAPKAEILAVDDANFSIRSGETLALVGESGSGKTTLARAAVRLIEPDAGSIAFAGEDLIQLPPKTLRALRQKIGMVFQDPAAALNPRRIAGDSLAEPFAIHGIGSARERQEKIAGLLDAVGLPEDSLDRYPHAFSGGQRQRLCIARALALDPALVIADEPLASLDVSVRSQILNLLRELKDARGLAYLFITHDLAAVAQIADRVAVMYLGRIVEEAPTQDLIAHPRHPYTKALIAALPAPGKKPQAPIGEAPSPLDPPKGCAFHPRCPKAADICRDCRPLCASLPNETERRVACHFPEAA